MIPRDSSESATGAQRGACSASATRFEGGGASVEARTEDVIAEDVLTLEIEAVGSYTLLCTPGDELPLAAGFALSEGLITTREDVLALRRCGEDPRVVRMRLRAPTRVGAKGRNLIVASSCGLCGTRRQVEAMLAELPRVGESLRVSAGHLGEALERLRSRQGLFRRTGGAHAAGLFTPDAELVAFAEDLGRHNALDKVIGQRILDGRTAAGLGAALSGRVSFELVAKCARAGLELVAAVSAPSSLALRAAERCGLTVCGFVRESRATAYTHPFRILDAEE
jgi:FdhD protein